MLFFRNDEQKAKEPKKRSLLGQLFNPNVGTEVGAVFEGGRMFVRMLALILAAYRLFPKDHPALKSDKVRLTLGEVMRTSYGNLSFTREGIPQIILFLAVFGCIAFSALFILTLILSLFVGSAHAETFTSPHPDTDWALKWINYLFQGQEITGLPASVGTQPAGCEFQRAMGTALAFYSSAVLVLAGFLLMYHLVFMIAEQAHTGKLMARANQIWAPIRLVFAIGMLVPIGAAGNNQTCGSITGYNTAQYIAMQVTRWGSGLGSRLWDTFVGSLAANQITVCNANGTGAPSCITNPVPVEDVVKALMSMEACSYFMDYYIRQANRHVSQAIPGGVECWGDQCGPTVSGVIPALSVPTLSTLGYTPGEKYLNLRNGAAGGDYYQDFKLGMEGRICGGYVVSSPISGAYNGVRQAQLDVLAQNTPAIATLARTVAESLLPSHQGMNQNQLGTQLNTLVQNTQTRLTARIASSLEAADNAASAEAANGPNGLSSSRFTASGWLMAGAWFSSIAKVQATRSDAVRKALPTFIRPGIYLVADGVSDGGSISGIAKSVAEKMVDFNKAVGASAAYPYNNLNSAQASAQEADLDKIAMMSAGTGNPVDALFQTLNEWMGRFNIWDNWNGANSIGLRFGNTSNPMAELASFGQSNIEYGTWMLTAGAGAGVLSGFLPSVFSGVGSIITSLLMGLAVVFFTIGFTIGFVVPLYPFYRFFFGAMSWAMTVFEAVVLAPIFALAHIEPHGDGLAGKNAKYGYSVLMQLILRPGLMVLGLIAGYLLFKVSISFLNEVFIYATVGTGAYSGATPFIAKVVYTIIYCAFVLILANQCFSTIGLFPQVALKWLGMQQITEERTAEPEKLAGAAAAGSALLASRLPGAASAVSGAIGGGVKELKSTAESNRVAGIAARRHQDLMEQGQDTTDHLSDLVQQGGQAAQQRNTMIQQGGQAAAQRGAGLRQGQRAEQQRDSSNQILGDIDKSTKDTADNTKSIDDKT